ncbi:unnamed protein product [Lymnaea stagnalis]|uniref:Uncharacterized protein n=1 Tax=Lymnaea stagnalis TaxID=6523 RepID=A0AAV2HLP1_LYMST
MEDQTNTDLWQRLAMKKLTDPNKSQKQCLDQALNVLARGLEVNKESAELWLLYLILYKRHPDVKDFLQFCQTALEYAPSYDIWFLYLSSLKTFPEKDEACTQALEFLHKTDQQHTMAVTSTKSTGPLKDVRTSQKVNSSGSSDDQQDNVHEFNKRPVPKSSQELGYKTSTNPVCENGSETTHIWTPTETNLDITSHCNIEAGADITSINSNAQSICDKQFVDGSVGNVEKTDSVENPGTSRQVFKKRSHQVLEMILLKAGLNLYAGKFKTALHFLQSVLGLKKVPDLHLRLVELLTSSDLLVLWLSYIYVLEWRHLPPCLYSISNENPGRLLSKDHITLPWSSKSDLHTSVDNLVNLHQTAMKVWTTSEKDSETMVQYTKLVQSLVALYLSQGKAAEAATACKTVLIDQQLVDIWMTTADLYASSNHYEGAIQVIQDALRAHPYSTKLQFHQNLFLASKGESELALKNLEQFVISHFEASSKLLHHLDPNLLYCQLLKQEEALHLRMARLKKDIPNNLHKDTYMWLCYSLLMELQGETTDTIEIYEKSLTQAHSPEDLVVIWQNYISYIVRSGCGFKDVRDIICRSIISMPTKRDIPFSSSPSATWLDYTHYNQLVESWLSVLPVEDKVNLMEMCLSFVPGNVQLLLRAVDLCVELKETRRAYSWCKMSAAQVDRPATAAFWKMAVALAHIEGTQREVEQMLIGCVETMPLAVSGWKDFLLFEVSRENLGAVEILLTHCRQLGLNIDGFVATISAT